MNPASAQLETPRVLLAVSPREREEFLPAPLAAELAGLFRAVAGPDPAPMTPEAWLLTLARENPDVLISGWSTPPLPTVLPARLRYVCHLGGSTRALVTRRHLESGLVVTNWGSSVARGVAEGGLALMLAALRRIDVWTLRLKCERGWRTDADPVESLLGRRVGIHGFGFVARELVQLLRPFGGAVGVFAPGVPEAGLASHGVSRVDSLEQLFSDHPVVVELAPLTPATRGQITTALLARVPAGGLFVNLARGPIVDEAALLAAAQSGRIRIALDVFHQEPLPADSPLRTSPSVILSPHVAGPTPDRRRDAGAFALRNLRAYREGRPLEAVVTPEIYDAAT